VNAVTKVVSAVLTVALMAAAMWLYDRKPHLKAGALHPLLTEGSIGSVVTTRDFSVKVGGVVVAAAIQKPDFPTPQVMKTPGLFLIVQAQDRSERRPFTPGHVRLVTRGGVAYQESGRAALPSAGDTLQPMLWTPVTYIFEIPKDRLAGARLVVGEADLLNQLSGETDVDLRIDADRAAQLSAHPTPTYALKTTL
jgi:hypothetical protein